MKIGKPFSDKSFYSEFTGMRVYLCKGYRLFTHNDMPEHRFVYEQKHGKIPEGLIIHHINHCKTDNRIENLEAMTQSEHAMIHFTGTVRQDLRKFTDTEKYCARCDTWKLLELFGNNKNSASGKDHYCKQCNKVRDAKRYPAKHRARLAKNREKRRLERTNSSPAIPTPSPDGKTPLFTLF